MDSSPHWSPWPAYARAAALILLFATTMIVGTHPTNAQTPRRDTLKPLFGVGNDEFYKGAWMKIRPESAGVHPDIVDLHWDQVWELADELGIDILRIQGHDFDNFDLTWRMIDSRTDTTGLRQRLLMTTINRRTNELDSDDFCKVSVGREVRFFPFTGLDSVEYSFWPSRFLTLNGGTTENNLDELDVYGEPAREQHYIRDSLTVPTLIARDIVFDQFPSQQYRWPQYNSSGIRTDGQFELYNTHDFLQDHFQFNRKATNQYVVVTGHLFEDNTSSAEAGDTILKIEVIYEIPRGQTYIEYRPEDHPYPSIHPAYTILRSDSVDIERHIDTLYVTKADLSPTGSPADYNEYREVPLRFDARWCKDSTNGWQNTGPLFPGNESRRINLKVTWMGNENIAIRSIALRDSIGQLVLGTSGGPDGDDTLGQFALLKSALRDARRGVTLTETGTGAAVWPVIARSAIVESAPFHGAVFNRLSRLVHDSVKAYDSVHGDTNGIPVWNETIFDQSLFQRRDEQANPRFRVPDAVVTEIAIAPYVPMRHRMKIKYGKLASIALHNGNRFSIPLLTIDTTQAGRDSIEHVYESTLQLLGFRQHIPFRGDEDMERYMHLPIARSAEIARDSRRRMIIVPFCVSSMYINYDDWNSVDSLRGPREGTHSMAHIPEPSEMRTMMNLGLCYGARGVLWQVIDGQYSFMDPEITAIDPSDSSVFMYTANHDFGIHNPLALGPNLDRFPEFHFYKSLGKYGYDDTIPRATILDFFTGWNIRSKAMTDIHRWIDIVGPHLVKLGWRDGYSMHFAVHQPYDTDSLIPHRPLASNEIVDSIRTRYPGSSVQDSLHRTFVELGLFYMKNASSNPMKDTNHIFLVNRRCFERTTDIHKDSATGQLMDLLAETRTIEVKLDLPHPDTTGYNFVRVQEIGCDTTRLPLSNVPRTPLDTIVNGDSVFTITLGPGRAALLRITYAPPTQSLLLGDLRFSSQRKLLYDGRRYHAVFHRWNPADPAGGVDTIFYRRSLPVDSSEGYAGIRWEPQEWPVSVCSSNPALTRYQNRFPSMTLRSRLGDTVVSVVWTCHPYDTAHANTNEREIVIRNIRSRGGFAINLEPFIEIVDWHKGTDPTQWGMPVICRADAGEFIGWSDSTVGIVARFRAIQTTFAPWWWWSKTYSPRDSVSWDHTQGTGKAGQYPTLPAFAHIASLDSNCGIAWQQGLPGSPLNEIRHRILVHDSSMGLGLRAYHLTAAKNDVSVSGPGNFYHPSIDQFQDFWQEEQNVVAWEELYDSFYSRIHLRSLYIETRQLMGWDTTGGDTLHNIQNDRIDTTYLWGWAKHDHAWKAGRPPAFMWPNAAALNQRASRYWAEHDTTTVNVVYSQTSLTGADSLMHRSIAQWADVSFKRSDIYTWGGSFPMGSASTERQEPRYATLYRTHESGGDTLGYTSREFFARRRPVGYMADGRSVVLRISDSLHTVIAMQLNDVWLADDADGRSARFVPRGDNRIRTHSISQVEALFRTEYFHASDSTIIGCSMSGMFTGDSSVGASVLVSGVVELVDSATGEVVHRLDSFAVSAAQQSYSLSVEPMLDLLGGTYYVRMRLVSPSMPNDDAAGDSRYPIAEVSEFVENTSLGKLRRIDSRPQATARISASPNPFTTSADIRFSISKSDYVYVTVYDQLGRVVTRLVDRTRMEAGRYEVILENLDLEPGTYVIELRSGDVRAATKVIRMR